MARRYHAFISYAHSDEHWARWLQRSLERFRVPRKLRKLVADERSLSKRLHPIFRDRDEFASSSNLSKSIRTALDDSDALIVVCSPVAARSQWVAQEIRYFQASGRSDRIFCFLVEGAPQRTAEDCAFPPALLRSGDGSLLPEPLAADIRAYADGKRGAVLRMAAGLLAVGFDDLRQRDAQRQLRLRGALTAASLMIATVTIGLAIAAQLARDEADVRRAQAESMIGFMLGDLRSRLEPVGRLDLLDAVGDEAMRYFAELAERGTEQEVFTRAMALRQIGEVRFRQGRLEPAAESFAESRNITESLYTSEPGNLEYLFELGQAEFWVGNVALERSQIDLANAAFQKYMEYSRTLYQIDSVNAVYQLELSYAYSNLGTVALELQNPELALDYFEECLALSRSLVDADPDDLDLRHELGNAYSWLGATLLQLGRLEEGIAAYRAAVDELSAVRNASDDIVVSEHFGENVYHLGNAHANEGELAEAESLFDTAHRLFDELVNFDQDNAIWRGDRAISAYHRAELLLVRGETDAARQLASAAAADFEQLIARDAADLRSVEHLALAERLIALIFLDNGSIGQALALSSAALRRMTEATSAAAIKPRTIVNAARVAEAHGRVLLASGDEAAGTATWSRALELLRENATANLEQVAVVRQIVARLEGEVAAAPYAARLADAGFADPRFR